MSNGFFPRLLFLFLLFTFIQWFSMEQCQETFVKDLNCKHGNISYKSNLVADIGKKIKPGHRFKIPHSKGTKPVLMRNLMTDLSMNNHGKEEYMAEQIKGAFLGDYYVLWLKPFTDFFSDHCEKDETTEKLTTATTTTESTSILITTATIPPNPIKCSNPIWVLVRPAPIWKIFNGRKVIQDLAIRSGFLDFNNSDNFLPTHINETIKELLQNTSTMIGQNDKAVSEEVNNWIEANKDWLIAISHGTFQYFRINREWASDGEIVMLMHRCSFGNFIISPLHRAVVEEMEKTFDWTMDFNHLEKCEEVQEELFSSIDEEDRTYYIGETDPMELQVKLGIGVEILDEDNSLNRQQCEAFKYKYGYTAPLRDQSLDENADDCARVKRMGRIIFRIGDVACRNLRTYILRTNVRKFSMGIMRELGFIEDDCSKGNRNCIKCLLKASYESDCKPEVQVELIQTVYQCDKFKIWLPRLDVRQHFTADNKTYNFIDKAKTYKVSFSSNFYRKINVPYGYCAYNLYEEKFWLKNLHRGEP